MANRGAFSLKMNIQENLILRIAFAFKIMTILGNSPCLVCGNIVRLRMVVGINLFMRAVVIDCMELAWR
jgi:hypothetical protein